MGDLYRSHATSCTAARHNQEPCKDSEDARQAGSEESHQSFQDACKEQGGGATAAAVDQAVAAAADGEQNAACRQDDAATAPGAPAVEAGAADKKQPQDAHGKDIPTLSQEEHEEAEEGSKSRSLSPAPDQSWIKVVFPDGFDSCSQHNHSGSIGDDTAENECAKAHKEPEREKAKQKCRTAASASATLMKGFRKDGEEKFQERFDRYYGHYWHGVHIGGNLEVRKTGIVSATEDTG